MNNSQRRKEEKEAAKHGKEERFICPFPNCGVVFYKQPDTPDVCPNHRRLIADVQYILAHLKEPEPPPVKPKIILPGGIQITRGKKP